jgi:hypothetical protein
MLPAITAAATRQRTATALLTALEEAGLRVELTETAGGSRE